MNTMQGRRCLPCNPREVAERAQGSTTQTTLESNHRPKKLILKLKEPEAPAPKVTWAEDTVNNEGMNKRSSKRCCIFHAKKQFGDSDSDESDSDIEVAEEASKKGDRRRIYQRFHA